ncbi:MAG TPA: serine/threonine-protein kinase [Polyangia bacterium]|nr:serine/threonine-protein kinase [Polyangia bacterium]
MESVAAASPIPGVLEKGAVIGRYLVLGLVGRGGMGEVYAAYDPELDRKVAVKLLRGQTADAEGRVRLLREAQAIAKLSHPNVIVVFDVGTFKDSVFIAMEFVDGSTVGYWLQAATRTWRDVLRIFAAAGRGLVAAHGAGMVHRDFKPDNVMITKDGQVRVMDFGLARRFGADAEPEPAVTGSGGRLQHLLHLGEEAAPVPRAPPVAAGAEIDLDATAKLGPGMASPGVALPSSSGRYLEQKLTQTGAMVGTPAYMAPEQFAGAATDARTDQFSFCVALYEALYGHRPFEGDSVVALMSNVVTGTVRTEPPVTAVPARLRRVLLRGLEADPDKRYASMSELLAELERAPVSRSRAPLAALAAATLGAALVLGLRHSSRGELALCGGADAHLAGVWERAGDGARKQTIRKVFEAKAKGDGARIFAGVSGLLDAFVGRWADMYRDTCEATHVRGDQSAEVLDLRMACLAQRLGGVKALTDLLATADASVIENAANAAGALPNLEGCADVQALRSVVPPPSDARTRERVAAVRADVAKARALGDAGQCAQALAASEAALGAAREVAYGPLVAEASYVRGRSGDYCGETRGAIASLEDATFAAEASRDDELAVEAASFAAVMYSDRFHDSGAARRWLRYSDAILHRLPGHPLLEAHTLLGWGVVYQIEGKDAQAVEAQERALALKEQALGPLHPDSATSAINVGLALHELGRDADAEPYAARAVETLDRVLGPESAQLAIALLDHAEIATSLGRFADARRDLDRALAIWKKAGADAFFIAYGRLDLARLELAEKRPSEARRLVEGSVDTIAKQDATMGALARFVLAEALWSERRERARAEALARQARSALVAANAPAHKVAEVDTWLGAHASP